MRTIAIAFVLSLTPLLAQKATFEWQKRTSTIEFGGVPVGKHTLAELPVGQSWRLGANQPTIWHLGLPAIVGDRVIAPGDYELGIVRSAETTCALSGAGDVRIDGPLAKAAKPGKKLIIEWAKDGAAANGNQPVKLVVQFGENEWRGSMVLPGSKTTPVGAFKLTVFSLPSAVLATRDKAPVAIAVLARGDDEAWNLMLGKDTAELVPLPRVVPRGATPPATPASVAGSVEAMTPEAPRERAVLEATKSSAAKGEIVVELAFGSDALRVKLPEPKAANAK